MVAVGRHGSCKVGHGSRMADHGSGWAGNGSSRVGHGSSRAGHDSSRAGHGSSRAGHGSSRGVMVIGWVSNLVSYLEDLSLCTMLEWINKGEQKGHSNQCTSQTRSSVKETRSRTGWSSLVDSQGTTPWIILSTKSSQLAKASKKRPRVESL